MGATDAQSRESFDNTLGDGSGKFNMDNTIGTVNEDGGDEKNN